MSMRLTLAIAGALLLVACAREETQAPAFHAEGFPKHLSEWSVVSAHDGVLELSKGVIPYDLATPLFTDYALKLRTLWLPEGASAVYQDEETFDFPVGTIITKTFFYPQAGREWNGHVAYGESRTVEGRVMPLGGLRLIETRVLARRENGWIALPYVWNDGQTDAVLKRAGDVIPLTMHKPDGRELPFAYIVPNANQCAGCHATNNTTRAVKPIGPKARHLNKPSTFAEGMNQLEHWRMIGLLTGDFAGAASAPRNVAWDNESENLEARARAYLDANCSHCHSDVGPADTSGLDLRPDIPHGPKLGFCKTPIAAGGGTGGRRYDIIPGNPDGSITIFRMETTEPGAMMPELGRSLAHDEGVALIAQWIAGLTGACE